MPWESKTVEKIRKEFIQKAIQKEISLSALCHEYGISRPTAYKWLNRFQNGEKGGKARYIRKRAFRSYSPVLCRVSLRRLYHVKTPRWKHYRVYR